MAGRHRQFGLAQAVEQRQPEFRQGDATGQAPFEERAPLGIASIELGDDGGLRIRNQSTPVRFRFHFHGLPFDVEIQAGDQRRVRICANLGLLPYTAESPLGRRYCQRAIQVARRLPRGRLFLDAKNYIRLEAEAVVPDPTAPASVFSAVTALLLDFLPYLRFLREVLPGRSRCAGVP